MKPNISHLWEFGTPVWVLLQGQKEPPKMEPKLKQQIFMGYDNGSKSIKYYNMETHKILTSQNYCFLSPTKDNIPPEHILVTSNAPQEGEHGGRMLPTLDNKSDSLEWK
jgi:hypothetical protein